MRLGRNQPCWCNSGIKYKKCHYNRESQKPVSEAEIYQASNKFYSSKSCSVPDAMKHECNKKIIKAHSVSKGSSLKAISVDGHVLTTLNLNAGSYKNFKPVLIGINKASTFTGFCEKHDAKLFSPIENSEFDGSA